VAERGVQNASNTARAMILHSADHWKDGIDASLWPMAVSYATHLYNHLPNKQGLCPADLFTGSTPVPVIAFVTSMSGLPGLRVRSSTSSRTKTSTLAALFLSWCLPWVQFASLQRGPLVLNLQTGSITPQYYVVFDNHFSTASSDDREDEPPGQ
jgi:hypothetical protein